MSMCLGHWVYILAINLLSQNWNYILDSVGVRIVGIFKYTPVAYTTNYRWGYPWKANTLIYGHCHWDHEWVFKLHRKQIKWLYYGISDTVSFQVKFRSC